MKIKIAFSEHTPPYDPAAGGIASYIRHRAWVLGKVGFEVWWFNAHSVARWDANEMIWTDRREFSPGKLERRLAGRWPGLQATWQYLAKEKAVDVMEWMAGTNSWLPFGPNYPRVVLHCHTSTFTRAFLNGDAEVERHMNLFRRWAKRNLAKAHGILAPSNEIGMLEAGYFHLHPDRITILPHAYCRQAELGLNHTHRTGIEPKFLVVGNVEYFKALDLALQAFGIYRGLGGKGQLLVAGCGGIHELHRTATASAVKPAYEAVVREHGEESVRFLGKISKDQLANHRAQCTAIVHASRFEALTLVAGEAFLSGCPLILSERTGWRALAERFHAARLVDPYDARDLASALKEMEGQETQARYIAGGNNLADYLTSNELALKTVEFYRRVALRGSKTN